VNYELPNVPEDYVHRIGRTGRAGAAGEAISLVSSDESGFLRDIERVLRRSIPTLPTPQFKIVESAPQAPSQGNRGSGERSQGDRPGNRPAHSQGRQGHHGGGRDSRRAPAGSASGTRSFGQQQRGRFR
jgi:ATP-dependent RNA helicase RhlE